ncbi:19656_t:CDS:1, partial [Entrophospora sp. SA101]
KLQEVFGKCQEAIQSGKIHEMDGSRFNGNAETGKATFQAIANSLSVSNQEDFHFCPQENPKESNPQGKHSSKLENENSQLATNQQKNENTAPNSMP